MQKINVLFGHVPGEYDGDADKFLSQCDLVDDEIKAAIALIMRKCPCAVVFGTREHEIDATAGGRVGKTEWHIVGKKKIAILIS